MIGAKIEQLTEYQVGIHQPLRDIFYQSRYSILPGRDRAPIDEGLLADLWAVKSCEKFGSELETGGQRTEDRGQRIEDRGQRIEDR